MNCSLVPNPACSADEKFVVVMLCRGCPIMLGLIIIFKGYYNTIRELQNLPEGILIEMDYNIYKLLWYPTVLLVVFTPSVIDQLVAFYNPGRPIWLTMLRVGITHSLGFYNCIMYVMMRKLYNTPDKYLERNSIDSKSSRSSSFSVTEELLIAGARL